jgi:hypothetical protein
MGVWDWVGASCTHCCDSHLRYVTLCVCPQLRRARTALSWCQSLGRTYRSECPGTSSAAAATSRPLGVCSCSVIGWAAQHAAMRTISIEPRRVSTPFCTWRARRGAAALGRAVGERSGRRTQRARAELITSQLPNGWPITYVSKPDVPFLYHEVLGPLCAQEVVVPPHSLVKLLSLALQRQSSLAPGHAEAPLRSVRWRRSLLQSQPRLGFGKQSQ